MELADEKLALKHLREARTHMQLVKVARPSRELSVALTECETAILWLEQDYHVKLEAGDLALPVHTGGVLPP